MISELKVGGPALIDYFAVIQKASKTTGSGKPFLDIQLGDKSGTVVCRMWDREDIAPVAGDVVQVAASIDEYPPGKVQLRIEKIRRAKPGEYSMADLLPASDRPAEEMYNELTALVDAHIIDKQLCVSLLHILEDQRDPLLFSPASKSYHHAFVGGLLEHILGIAHLAVLVTIQYQELNSDVLIAGAILHDIGKLQELRPSLGFGYTPAGKLLGHVPMGFAFVKNYFEVYPASDALVEQILHLVASHHGELEHGAAVVPQTKEAIMFHELDMIDSRMGAIRAAEKLPVDEDGFTAWIPMFKAQYFKGKECPTQPQPPTLTSPPSMPSVSSDSKTDSLPQIDPKDGSSLAPPVTQFPTPSLFSQPPSSYPD